MSVATAAARKQRPRSKPRKNNRPDGELIPKGSPLAPYISVDPGRMHGEPVFKGSRVPIQALFDHLRAGDSFQEFLNDFEGVSRDQVVGVIDLSFRGLLTGLRL